MRPKTILALATAITLATASASLRADELRMQNGDRYLGKVLSVSTNMVVMDSDVLGRITVPRSNVAHVTFGTNAVAATATNQPTHAPTAPATALTGTNTDLAAALRSLGANTNFIAEIRKQMVGDNPEAAQKYDEMVGGLLSGKLNMDDLMRQVRSSVEQMRSVKRDLGPDADQSLDLYLGILENFLKADGPGTNGVPATPAKRHAP